MLIVAHGLASRRLAMAGSAAPEAGLRCLLDRRRPPVRHLPIHFSLGPVGAALLTWAAGHFGVLPACLASGAACLVIGGAALVTPIRRPATRPGATVVGS